ncbi:hypothetical protein ACIA5E_20465 [Nocardia asteroides]|uniref:hypothetical protein n=1 Tax=Nocardia asteroides TaxID=1824 RepID=UPI0037970530
MTNPRSRRRLIVALVVVAVAVPTAVWGVSVYLRGQAPKGTPLSGLTPPAVCALPESVLAQTRTHNFREYEQTGQQARDDAPDLDFSCAWDQLEGRDGVDSRSIGWRAYRFDGPDGDERARRRYESLRTIPSVRPPFETRDADGFAGQASVQQKVDKSGNTELALIVLDRNRVVVVRVDAADQRLLWTRPTPFPVAESLTALVAREVLQRPW